MNDLLPELWTIIFKMMNLVDQSKCRLVCSEWKNIVDSIKVNDLLIYDSFGHLANSWFISNETINLKNELWNLKFSSTFQFPQRFYQSVRRLKLNTLIDTINLKLVEKFDQLEQLDICLIVLKEILLINLPNLNKLYIGSTTEENSLTISSCN